MSETASWQPSASIPNLLKRAAIMAEIRRFFADRGVLEVETPCMSQATVTDIHLVPFETRFVGPGHSQGMNLWLMTSPEYHMKRLLVAGIVHIELPILAVLGQGKGNFGFYRSCCIE